MDKHIKLDLATEYDASAIAKMSRDLIEVGLGWSWTPSRVIRSIRDSDTVVLTARCKACVAGFAIMNFALEDAHLNLLSVSPDYQRCGLGRRLIDWLEKSALVAGTSIVYLEVRTENRGAQVFYERLGYRQIKHVPDYYGGRESAIFMARDLWCSVSPRTL